MEAKMIMNNLEMSKLSSKDILDVMTECEKQWKSPATADDLYLFLRKSFSLIALHYMNGDFSSQEVACLSRFIFSKTNKLIRVIEDDGSDSFHSEEDLINEIVLEVEEGKGELKSHQNSAEFLRNFKASLYAVRDCIASYNENETVSMDICQQAMTVLIAKCCNAYRQGFVTAREIHIAGMYFDAAYESKPQ